MYMTAAHAYPSGLKFSKTMAGKLPPAEKSDQPASLQKLWDKALGKCSLCDFPLPSDEKSIEIDHILPEADGGPTEVSNLQLTHKSCNRSKRSLPNNVAIPIIKLQAWCKTKSNPSFDDVLNRYNIAPKNVEISIDKDIPTLKFDSGDVVGSQIHTDPTSGVKYFFAEVPVDYIHNDVDVQPRMVQHTHVRKIMMSLSKGPLHEPSNVRAQKVSGDVYKLLQFDGQHKATAQIAMNRKTVQMKVYMEISVATANDLVITIQKDVKKKALSQSDTMAKLNDVMGELLDNYVVAKGQIRTEKGFIESLPNAKQTDTKNLLINNLIGLIANNDTNKLFEYYQPPYDKKTDPVKDSIVMTRIIKPLIEKDMLETDMDDVSVYMRDEERNNIIWILDCIYEEVIKDNWINQAAHTTSTEAKVRNFFQQAGLYMMMDIFPDLLKIGVTPSADGSYLLKTWSQQEKDNVQKMFKAIFKNSVWSSKNSKITQLWNVNKGGEMVKAAAQEFNLGIVFKDYNNL